MIDFRKDIIALNAMISNCVRRYVAGAEQSVSRRFYPPVTRIDLTFSMGDGTSTPYVYLSMDTREGSEPDGGATHPVLELMEFTDWKTTASKLAKISGSRDQIILVDGHPIDCDDSILQTNVGNLLVYALKSAREHGAFQKLPFSSRCELAVGSMDGEFGWPIYQERGRDNLVFSGKQLSTTPPIAPPTPVSAPVVTTKVPAAIPFNKDHFVQQLAVRSSLTTTQVRALLQAQVDMACEQARLEYPIPGIGWLVTEQSEAREMIMRFGPKAGQKILVPAKARLKFRTHPNFLNSWHTGKPSSLDVFALDWFASPEEPNE